MNQFKKLSTALLLCFSITYPLLGVEATRHSERVISDDMRTVRLIERICQLFSELGIYISIEDEFYLYSFSRESLINACDLLSRAQDTSNLKEAFWDSLETPLDPSSVKRNMSVECSEYLYFKTHYHDMEDYR